MVSGILVQKVPVAALVPLLILVDYARLDVTLAPAVRSGFLQPLSRLSDSDFYSHFLD